MDDYGKEVFEKLTEYFYLFRAYILKQRQQEAEVSAALSESAFNPDMIYLPGHPFYGLAVDDIQKTQHLENSITNVVKHKAAEKEVKKEMPPQYKDGSFRIRNINTNQMEYRFMHNSKVLSVYGYSEQECWNKRTAIISGRIASKATKQYRLCDWLDEYFRAYKTRKDGSMINTNNLYNIRHIKSSPIAGALLKNIQGIEIQKFLKEFDDRPNTRKKLYILLNAVFEKAKANRFIKYNPCDAVSIESHTCNNFNVIQPLDQSRIIKSIDNPKYLAFFWYLTCTGMRISEAVESLNSIDLEKNIINVCGKDTVTKKHTRQIPFLPELFINGRIELLKQVTSNSARIYFRKLFERLNIKAVVHSMRHTFASCCYHVGIKDKQTQTWLGHSSIKMTMDTYTHLLGGNSPIIEYFRRLKKKLGI